MKITKIAQMAPVAQNPAVQAPVAGDAFQEALDPRMKMLFVKALQGTGLSKKKVLPFLEQLFTAMGDIPLSKVTGLLKSLTAEDESGQPPVQQPIPQASVPQGAPDQGVAAQETQTMGPPAS